MSELIDNRAHRIRTLKQIIQQLHSGVEPDEVRGTLRLEINQDLTRLRRLEGERRLLHFEASD